MTDQHIPVAPGSEPQNQGSPPQPPPATPPTEGQAPPAAPQQGYGQQPLAPQGYAPQPAQPGAYPPPPGGGYAPAPPGGQRPSGMIGLIAGGLALVLVLGGFGWFLLGSRDSAAPPDPNPPAPEPVDPGPEPVDPSDGPGPAPQPEPNPEPAPQPNPNPQPPPQEGSIGDIVPVSVPSENGNYEAVAAAPGDEFTSAGAIDGIFVEYLGPDGGTTVLALGLFQDEATSAGVADDVTGNMMNDGFELIESGNTEVGVYHMLGRDDGAGNLDAAFVWTNGPLIAFTIGPFPGPIDVYYNLPF